MIPRGRAILEEELDYILANGWRVEMETLLVQGFVSVVPGVDLDQKRCNRCGGQQLVITVCGSCAKTCAYCNSCLQMGRSKACTSLYLIEAEQMEYLTTHAQPFLEWKGELTTAQKEASEAAAVMVRQTSQKLIWAV